MLYGELGRYPYNILCKSRMAAFWQRIVNGKQDKTAFKLGKISLSKHQCRSLISISNYIVWNSQDHVPQTIAKTTKLTLIEKIKQEWSQSVFTASKCFNYRIFKANLVLNSISVASL